MNDRRSPAIGQSGTTLECLTASSRSSGALLDGNASAKLCRRMVTWRDAKVVPFSMFAWSSAFGVMLGSSLVSAAMRPFRTPAEQSLWSARAFARVLPLTGTDVDVRYDPRFDRERPSVFCQNHVSVLDAFAACYSIPQPFVGLMLSWHFKVPGYGWMMRATNGIPVYPASRGRTERLIEAARDRASKGLSILVFPEAHRTLDGKLREFKRGVFFMARDAELPVVPLAVKGLYDVNHKGSPLVVPGHKVRIYVGPQLETRGLDDGAIVALAGRMQSAVAAYVDGPSDDASAIAALPDA